MANIPKFQRIDPNNGTKELNDFLSSFDIGP